MRVENPIPGLISKDLSRLGKIPYLARQNLGDTQAEEAGQRLLSASKTIHDRSMMFDGFESDCLRAWGGLRREWKTAMRAYVRDMTALERERRCERERKARRLAEMSGVGEFLVSRSS